MDFKLKCKVTDLVKSGQSQHGNWFLYNVQESLGERTKTWRVFTKIQLFQGGEYEINGNISESPNKMYKNDNGKHPYQTSFNAVSCEPLQPSFGSEPVLDNSENIPF